MARGSADGLTQGQPRSIEMTMLINRFFNHLDSTTEPIDFLSVAIEYRSHHSHNHVGNSSEEYTHLRV